MLDSEKDGLTQSMITDISGVSASTVSKHILRKQYHPIPSEQQRKVRYKPATSRKIISELLKNVKKPSLKKHCFYNFKGGTGKTSICFQVSALISLMGYRVLCLDLDPQSHLSTSLGLILGDKDPTIYDKIVNNINLKNLFHVIYEGYDCLPSSIALTRIERYLSDSINREKVLSRTLSEIEEDYDFIFIDMNPSISLLNWNVITYSDIIHIVTETQPYSINSISLLIEQLENYYNAMDLKPRKLHIIPNKYEDRASSSAESMMLLKTYYEPYLKPDFAIRKSEEINTGAKLGKPLPYFAKKNSVAFKDILELSKHIVEIST